MSYTNGGQTIDKSMNGIISYDTGGGVVIEGDTITASGVTAENITCETLQVNTSATFAGTATFDSALPKSTITTTTSNTQFITKGIGDTLYAGGSILADNNVWTGQNSYNTYLPTSTLTGTPTSNQIAPLGMLESVLAPKASPTFTGTVTLPTTDMAGQLNVDYPQQIKLGGLSNNYIRNTNVDGATDTACNIEIACWNGLRFFDLISGTAKIWYDVRGGVTFTKYLDVATNMSIGGTNIFSLFGSLTTGVTNTWLSTNVFNAILPTSTLTGTPTATQIAPYSMLSSVLAPKASPTFTGTVTLPTTNMTGNLSCNTGNQINISGFSTNYIKNTGLDGATPTTCNVEVGLWYGLGFRDLISNITKIFFDARVGAINCVDLFVTTALYVNNININTIYGALTTGATNTWLSTNVFNSILPTSTLTGTPNSTDIAPVSMLNALYGRLTTGVTNTWLSTNVFNSILPTSTLTGTPNSTDIAPVSMLNDLYGRLGIANTWSARNTFSSGITVTTDVSCNSINCASSSNFGSSVRVAGAVVCDGCQICPQMTMQIRGFDSTGQYLFTNAATTTPKYIFGFDYFGNSDTLIIEPLLTTFYNVLKIKSPATTATATNALVIENTETSPSQINFLLNAVASTANPNVTAGDDVIYSNGGVLNLTTSSATAVGIRMSSTDIQTRANTTTLTGTTLNNDITTTNINSTTLAISSSTATTFVNLPSTTTAFTTATADSFITKRIGDAIYAKIAGTAFTGAVTFNSSLPTTTITSTTVTTNQFAPVIALDARYAPIQNSTIYAKLAIANTFTANNTFSGTTNTIGGTNAIMGATTNIIRRTTDGNSVTASLSVRDLNATRQIVFNPASTVNHLNGIVEAGDAVICSAPQNQSPLTLTCSSTNNVGVRIDGGNNSIFINGGQTTIDTNVAGTSANPMLVLKNTAPTQSRISFHLDTNAVGMINPMVGTGENVIYSGDQSTGAGTKNLVLTVQSTVACGIKISRGTSNVLITGTSVTINPPITVGYTTAPTFTSAQIGYTFQSGQFTWNGATPNQVYQSANLISIPVLGVWKVDAYLRVYTATRPCRYTWSISPYNLLPTHDINRVTTDVYEFREDPSSIYMMTTYTKFHAAGTLLAATVDGDNNQFVPPIVPYTYGYYYVLTRLA